MYASCQIASMRNGFCPISVPAHCSSVSFDAALADAGDADVGLDRHDHVALVEERVELRRAIDPHASDPRRWETGSRIRGTQQPDRGRRRDRVQKDSSVH